MIEKYIQALKKVVLSEEFILGDSETVLSTLYECYDENHPSDNEEISAEFNELYRQMNGMTLRVMDKVVYHVSKLCRDHEKTGFIEGIKTGIRIVEEIA